MMINHCVMNAVATPYTTLDGLNCSVTEQLRLPLIGNHQILVSACKLNTVTNSNKVFV